MNELIKITYQNDEPAVSARDLYEFLEVGADYRHWFPRMCATVISTRSKLTGFRMKADAWSIEPLMTPS